MKTLKPDISQTNFLLRKSCTLTRGFELFPKESDGDMVQAIEVVVGNSLADKKFVGRLND